MDQEVQIMDKQWIINTHGDPLGTVRELLHDVWTLANLDSMLLPTNGNVDHLTKPNLVSDPAALDQVNPFKPLMTMNAARLIPKLVKDNPQAHLGALLRPCEMRALIEMTKHNGFKLDGFVTVCVDCLGTVPADEYQWRAERKGASAKLADETLQFARQGGIADYRYRSACQICSSPEACGADINVNVLGLPVRQNLLVTTHDETKATWFQLDIITNGPATPELVQQHNHVVERMVERHHNTMQRVSQHLGDLLPQDIESLIVKLESCGDCQVCMNVCPICEVDFPHRGPDQHYQREDFTRWLVSCAGCGMCEQSCTNQLPLTIIFGHIRDLLADELEYMPGRSLNEPLPRVQ
jgi:formate dehydrogenase subunit beta